MFTYFFYCAVYPFIYMDTQLLYNKPVCKLNSPILGTANYCLTLDYRILYTHYVLSYFII